MNFRSTAAALILLGLVTSAAAAAESPGTVLTSPTGMTLYTFDKDSADKSACNGPCAALWPPYMAAADARAHDDWTIITRDDGSRQWAYKGHPLYVFSKDMKPSDTSGDGFKDIWHTAKR
jgi:predicted lipoprotein with Yx(FWY)xxD motif